MAGERPRALNRDTVLLAATVVGIATGGILALVEAGDAAHVAFGVTTVLGILPLAWSTIGQIRQRQTGVDLIALLAMTGALAFGEYEAGAVLALMLSSGQALEDYADRRAHKELSALLDRAPRLAHRYVDGALESVGVEEVRPGDLLLVKTGEVVPVDGLLASPTCVLDESALTGESRPVERGRGDQVRSGAVNAGVALDLRAVATSAGSTYAGIVRLVEEAEKQKAPFVRLADRYALFFIPLTLVIAGLAWGLSGDPVRALAVLVVATPCPMILAAPIAIVAGISRAAKRGIIVKGGGALETLARGTGIRGRVDRRAVALGKTAWATRGAELPSRARDVRRRSALEGSSCVFVAIDGRVAGALILDDPIRPDTPRVIRTLRRAGIRRVVMVTGDHPDVAESVGISIGVDRIMSERDPADKV